MLGFPTANLKIRWDAEDEGAGKGRAALADEERAVLDFASDAETGIYAAFACVEDGEDRGVYKVAMSVGWNPTFTDLKRKTIEAWILHDYAADFYGRTLRLLVLARVRPELKFGSLDELTDAIREDGAFCSAALAPSDPPRPDDLHNFRSDELFSNSPV